MSADDALPRSSACARRATWRVLTLLAWSLWLAMPQARADATLAARQGCLGCHAVEKARVGPALREVARRYAGQPDAAARLVRKVREGGRGQWGHVPMPAHPRLAEDDARRLVDWVLALPR